MKTKGKLFGVELSTVVWVGMSAFEVFCQTNDKDVSQEEIDDFVLRFLLGYLHNDEETALINTSDMFADLSRRLDAKKIALTSVQLGGTSDVTAICTLDASSHFE